MSIFMHQTQQKADANKQKENSHFRLTKVLVYSMG